MDPRLAITFGLYFTLFIGAGLSTWGWIQVRSFLNSHSSLNSQAELEIFKQVVKTNMFLALAVMAIFGLAIATIALGIQFGYIWWADISLPLFILGPICAVAGLRLTAAEKRMKNITLNDQSLRPDFEHVVSRWNSSAFPDW